MELFVSKDSFWMHPPASELRFTHKVFFTVAVVTLPCPIFRTSCHPAETCQLLTSQLLNCCSSCAVLEGKMVIQSDLSLPKKPQGLKGWSQLDSTLENLDLLGIERGFLIL